MSLTGTISNKRNDSMSAGELLQKYVDLSLLAGTKELVAAATGKQIQLVSICIANNANCKFQFLSAADVIMTFHTLANETRYWNGAHSDSILFATSSGEALNILCAEAPSSAGIYIQYRYRDI